MRSDEASEDGEGRLPVGAIVAVLAALYAAALAVGMFDGVPPPESQHGGAALGAVARPAMAEGGGAIRRSRRARACASSDPGANSSSSLRPLPPRGTALRRPRRPSSGTARS